MNPFASSSARHSYSLNYCTVTPSSHPSIPDSANCVFSYMMYDKPQTLNIGAVNVAEPEPDPEPSNCPLAVLLSSGDHPIVQNELGSFVLWGCSGYC